MSAISLRRASAYTRLNLAALAFFFGLALLVLHPMLFSNGVSVAGYDYFNYNWNYWWARHALTTPGLNLYENNFVMFPYTTSYGYHALSLVWFPLWSLLEPFLGTLTAVNLIILLGCTLNGWLMFLLLRREGVAPALALLGGAALQVSPILRYFYYNTHLNLMDWFWLPAQLLLWGNIVRAIAASRFKQALFWAVVQGVTLWGVLHTDLQFPIFTAFLLAPYVLFTLWRSRRRLQLLLAGMVAVLVAAPLAWFLGPLPYILRFSGTLAPGTVEDRPGIPLSGFLTMSEDWWHWASPSLGAFMLVVVLATVLFGWRHRRYPRFHWLWFVLMLPPLILSLGPNLTIGSTTIAMLPFRLLYDQTNGMFRMPWRLAPIFIVAAVVFVGKTWTPLFRRVTPSRIFAAVGVFLFLAASVRLFASAPLMPVPTDYQFYHAMRAETGTPYDDYVVLEVPNGAASGEIILGDPRAAQLQYYGIVHQKRMVNGFISRAPLEHFWYMLTDDPMLSWLGQRRFLEPQAVEVQLRQRIFEYPIGYIVIHRDLIGLESATVTEILAYFNSLDDLLCPPIAEGAAVVYRTRWHPDGCAPRTPSVTAGDTYTIDIGSPGDEAYIGTGWHYQEQVGGLSLRWAGDPPQTLLYVYLPPAPYTVTVAAQAYHEPRALRLLVNGTPLGEAQTVAVDALRDYAFALPADVLGDGKHVTLTLDYDSWVVPAEIGQGADTRRLAVAVDTIRFTQQSAEQ